MILYRSAKMENCSLNKVSYKDLKISQELNFIRYFHISLLCDFLNVMALEAIKLQ
jgi:hypothetical protein